MKNLLRASIAPALFTLLSIGSALAISACGEPSNGASSSGGQSASGAGGAASTASSSIGAGGASSGPSASVGAGGSTGAGGAGGGSASLTLLSLNLHCFKLEGTKFADNDARFGAIAALVADQGVDALLLQESCSRTGEDALAMLRAAAEKATGEAWSSAWAFAHIGWTGSPDEADEGVALLVRGVLSDENTLEHAVQAGLRRVALSATLPGALGPIRATTVHLDVDDDFARKMQAREAAAAALVDTDPGFHAIVGGDFNDVEGSPTYMALTMMGYIDASAGLDASGIDHIFVHRAAPIRPTAAAIVFTGADAVSDHPGVLVRFEAAAGDAVTATRVQASATPGAGHFISIRGSVAPLAWDVGWPMRAKSTSDWRFVTTELSSTFAFKLLRDDMVWQMGNDVPGMAGQDHQVTPSF